MDSKKVAMIFLLLFIPMVLFSQSHFNADSVYEHIRYLTQEIGPRPMGSPAERQALDWVEGKFRTYGADTSWVMPLTQLDDEETPFNTQSGIAIGIYYGEVDTSLAVSGHIDSNPAESPGANDNASGTATAIELARLWSQRPRHYTMIFLAFGGEEMGLYGSRYFVANYQDIDKVGLMISADMTGGEGDIVTIMETRKGQAPRWLVRDAFELNRRMDISPLRYPTHFATINNLGEGAGSDHMPFLDAGIPAIDFTTGLNTSPIHSAQDHLGNIDRTQLDQCGRFIDGLLSRYQSQFLPSRALEHYMLWMPFGLFLFIPKWLQLAVLGMALGAAVFAFVRGYQGRFRVEKSQRIRFSPLKLAALFLVVAACSQGGEALIQASKGLRHPWLAHVMPYLWLMACWAIAGLWLALQIARRWRWNRDPFVYSARTLVILALFTLLFSLASARLALYPALSLLLFSLAVLSRPAVVRMILLFGSLLPMLRLTFSEVLPFLARTMSDGSMMIDNFWKAALYTFFILSLLLGIFLPFINALAYIILRQRFGVNWVKLFRRPAVGVVLLILLAVITTWVCRLPSNDDRWRPSVQLQAKYELPKGESEVTLAGTEYFRGVRVQSDTLDLNFSGRTHKEKLPLTFVADWIGIDGTETVKTGERDTVAIDWLLHSSEPWYSVTLSIRADTLEIEAVDSELRYRHKKAELNFTWRANPAESLRVVAGFIVHPSARLIRKVTAIYHQPPLPVTVTTPFAAVSYRTKVILCDTLKVGQ